MNREQIQNRIEFLMRLQDALSDAEHLYGIATGEENYQSNPIYQSISNALETITEELRRLLALK